LSDSIIGHGWRRKQAHDASHDWIKYRRGLCNPANLRSLSFPFSRCPTPITAWRTLVRRSGDVSALLVESAAPAVKDPNRVPILPLSAAVPSLDSSPAFSSLRRMLEAVEQWLPRGEQLAHGSLRCLGLPFFAFCKFLALALRI